MAQKPGVVDQSLEKSSELTGQSLNKTKKAAVREAQNIITEARRQIDFFGLGPPPDEATYKQQQDVAIMEDIKGFREGLAELRKLQNRPYDEQELDDQAQREMEEKRKRLFENFHEMKTEHHKRQTEGSVTSPQEKQTKPPLAGPPVTAEDHEETPTDESPGPKVPKPPELPDLEQGVSSQSKESGPGLGKQKRRHNPPRTRTPRATANLKSAETRSNRE